MAINAALAKKSSAKRKVKKPMSKGAAIGVCVFVFILLLGGIVVALLTNVGGAGEKFLAVMPQYKKMVADLDKQKADLAAAQTQVQADTDKNANAAKANAKAAADIKTQQDALAAAQQALTAQNQSNLTAQQKQQAVLDIFTSLDASKAAGIMAAGYSAQEAANVLAQLPSDVSANILAAMDAAKAAEIAKLIGP
jgi:flagellar motility protein MotE (MotC chaperone)